MKDAVMVALETHEWRMVVEGLMSLHSSLLKATEENRLTWEYPWSEGELKHLMWRIMLHAGLPDAKRVVPEAYALCFPEGPPTVVGAYGKYRL